MKLLEIIASISSEAGGSVRSLITNVRAVHAADPEVQTTICSTDAGLTLEWRQEFEARLPSTCQLKVFAALGSGAFVYSRRLGQYLSRRIHEFDVVVIRKLFNPVSTMGARCARRACVPYIVVPHGTMSPYTFAHRRTLLKRLYFRALERETLAKATAVRFTSEAEGTEAPDWGADTPRFVIPHPYEPRSQLGSDGPKVGAQVLFLSRWDPVKGMNVLLEGFQIVYKEFPALRMVLAGCGAPAYESHIRRAIRHLGIERAVDIPGWVSGRMKSDLFRASSIFVLPSQQENFGMSVVEAMDAGLPVVISRGVNIWQDVEEAGAGIVLTQRTPESLAAALRVLTANDKLRREMGRRGQRLVRTAFNPDEVGRRLSELYHTAARGLDARGRAS